MFNDNKQTIKSLHRFASSQYHHILSQNEWQHEHGQCNRKVNEYSYSTDYLLRSIIYWFKWTFLLGQDKL
jgi:hypothetical protein